MMQHTLAIIKPDAVAKHVVGDIISRIEFEGFEILEMKMMTLRYEQATEFYKEHAGKHFAYGLIAFMCSGPSVPLVLVRENAVARLREIIGSTDSSKASPGTIRCQHGTRGVIHRNAIHASDSEQAALREISLIFPGFTIPVPGRYVARRSRDYSQVFSAKDLSEARKLAADSDTNNWESSWSDIEVEPE